MIAQHTPSHRHDVSTPPSVRPFWLTALLLLPAVNAALIGSATLVAEDLFVPVAALVALGELALLIPWARTYGIGVLGALATWLAIAAITFVGLIVVLLVAFAVACDGACLS